MVGGGGRLNTRDILFILFTFCPAHRKPQSGKNSLYLQEIPPRIQEAPNGSVVYSPLGMRYKQTTVEVEEGGRKKGRPCDWKWFSFLGARLSPACLLGQEDLSDPSPTLCDMVTNASHLT